MLGHDFSAMPCRVLQRFAWHFCLRGFCRRQVLQLQTAGAVPSDGEVGEFPFLPLQVERQDIDSIRAAECDFRKSHEKTSFRDHL